MTANDKSLARRVSPSITARIYDTGSDSCVISIAYPQSGPHRRRATFVVMSVEPHGNREPPPLPAALLEVWPVISVGALAWLVAAIAAFTMASFGTWRPTTLAGLITGLLGTVIFLWQRAAARRGARGAQLGLGYRPKSDQR